MTTPLITVTDLSWAPPDRAAPIFAGVRFDVHAGERVALTGPSGSGKSTLLRCIVGLEPRRSGTVLWRGSPVDAESVRRFRNRVVYMHQRPSQIAETVAENLRFARQMAIEFSGEDAPMSEQDQREMCDRLGLERMEFSRRFDDLSVGEQQRICLVRTLTARPNLLLLDEPTSALDPERVGQIEDILMSYVDEAPERRAYLWVSHQPAQIERLATRTVDLEQWTTVSDAAPDAGDAA